MRTVHIAVYEWVELLDVTGPAEVFSVASRMVGKAYKIELVAARPGPIKTSGSLKLIADRSFEESPEVDTVIIPGALDLRTMQPMIVPEVVAWARTVQARRIASVCVGAHMLAEAGLLDGHTATTHWYTADRLGQDFPQVTVDADAIFRHTRKIWTCAGVSAGMDMALAMVAEDHGEQVAREVARWMVMYLKRPGGQAQFSVPLSTPVPDRDDIGALQIWITENLSADLSVPALARRMNLSDRHFARLFTEQSGQTPAAYVDAARIEAARRLLEQSDSALDTIAASCGFGSVETLHRTFRRRQGMTPSDYRRRFK